MNAVLKSLAGLVVACAALPVLAAAGLEISVENEPIPERAKEVKSSKPIERSSWTEKVLIDGRWLVVESRGQKEVLDFEARRRYVVNTAAKTYTEHSLFAVAGFKSYEIHNREFLARALEKVQPDKAANALVLAEHELSIVHPRRPGKVDTHTSGGDLRFHGGGLTLFSISSAGTALSESDAGGLARYLRYFQSGHPIALRALQDQRKAPAEIGFLSGPFQAVQTTLRLKSIPVDAAPAHSLSGLKRVASSGHRHVPDDVSQLALKIAESKPDELKQWVERTGRRAETLLNAGETVRGFFVLMEYLLQGAHAQDLMVRYRDAFMASPQLKGIMGSINNAPDKEGAERAIAALSTARADVGDDAAILAVFEANHHLAVGRRQQAEQLFTAALRRNPYIASAWKDLGDLAYRDFDTPAAWLCWDTGRRIAPHFSNFEPVNQFEQRLLREQPDYLLKP